ncbi:hypothetical protein [Streptomyces pactum]|uniref:hypothetical protein n=1 Tax=Streptomyces pactum TaxID=68249 RepID=UPI0036F4ECB6
MNAAQQIAEPLDRMTTPRKRRGTTSLVLGVLAVAMFSCPWLPEFVSLWLRFLPVYFVVPTAIGAVVSGSFALRRMRDDEGADRRRARAGLTLGTVVLVASLAVLVWAYWVLNQAYS